jgi:hypothetical protein
MAWLLPIGFAILFFVYVQISGHRRRRLAVTAKLSPAFDRARRPRAPLAPGEHRTFRKQVHGILHNNADGTSRQAIIANCREGEEVLLMPEPDNPVDADAIKVCRLNGEQIGYWPGDDGQMVAQLQGGKKFRATIEEIYLFRDSPKRHGVALRIEVL